MSAKQFQRMNVVVFMCARMDRTYSLSSVCKTNVCLDFFFWGGGGKRASFILKLAISIFFDLFMRGEGE